MITVKKFQDVSLLALVFLAGCNFTTNPQGNATPTIEPIPMTATAEPTITLNPTPSPAPQLQVESSPLPTDAPPTITPTPSDTPGPYEHVIREGEILTGIIQIYGYTDMRIGAGSIIDQIVAFNPNIPNADSLPGAGAVIFIPRQTATATPANESTAAAIIASGPVVTLPANATITQYIVQDDDTLLSVIEEFNITLEIISQLNPDINIFNCDLSNPSGGPNCIVILQVGQAINVPAPTPTPTLSPTPSGSETATPLPTYPAPRIIFPPQGAQAPAGVFRLQWVSVGVLGENEYYLIEINDTTNNNHYLNVTKDTSFLLPDSLIPLDGQTHVIQWTVKVAELNENGAYRPIGGQAEVRTFLWQSR